MKKNSSNVSNPVPCWTVTSPTGAVLERVKIGRLIDIALEADFPPGDYIFEAAKLTVYLREQGYGVQYVNTGETESLEIDILSHE